MTAKSRTTCTFCGKRFQKYVKRNGKFFCSERCAVEFNRKIDDTDEINNIERIW